MSGSFLAFKLSCSCYLGAPNIIKNNCFNGVILQSELPKLVAIVIIGTGAVPQLGRLEMARTLNWIIFV